MRTQKERNLTRLVRKFGLDCVKRDKQVKVWRIYKTCGAEYGYGYKTERDIYANLGRKIGILVYNNDPMWQVTRNVHDALREIHCNLT